MATAMGGLIGMERERRPNDKYAGIRTLSLLGGVAPGVVAAAQKTGNTGFVLVYLFLTSLISLAIIPVRMQVEGDKIGFTTSVAVFVVATLGVLVGYDLYFEATSLAIISTFLLAEKKTLHSYVDRVTDREITSALQLGALGFIFFPVLPATAVDPFGAVVPQQILLLAIFVLLIEFVSYVSMRQLSPSSGLYLTGLLGGGASSFATVGVLTRMGKKSGLRGPASAAVMMASMSMLARNAGLAVLLFSSQTGLRLAPLLPLLVPFAGMFIFLGAAAVLLREEPGRSIEMPIKSPISLRTGLKFAVVFTAVSVSSALSQEFIGSAGTLLTSLLGGAVSSTAVVASAATSFTSRGMAAEMASTIILVSVAGSLVSKIALIELENSDMRRTAAVPLAGAGLVGLGLVLFMQ